jgi:hypothetical protein
MLKSIGRSIAVMAFAALTSLPAAGQVDLRFGIPLPDLEIRVGTRAPPQILSERKPRRPGNDFLWIKGSWHWQSDDWAWRPGRWERPDKRGLSWVKARYARDGNAWRYEPGHWSNQRVIEGEEYRRWRAESQQDRNHDSGRSHGKGHDKGHDR